VSTNRRNFLRGIGAGAAGLAISPRAFHEDTPTAVAFHGVHQAGIVTPPQSQAAHIAFDVLASGRAELTDLFHTITERARFLTTGGTPPEIGIAGPPTDSGIVGPSVSPDNLTVTVGVGASMFDGRFGLAGHKPRALTAMPIFPDDLLDPARTHGDLSLQLCADNRDTVVHALRDIARHTRGGMQIRWRADGFQNPPRPEGTPRNLMGFKDGTSNLEITVPPQMDRFVWLPAATEQPWTTGGSYQVVRIIRMLVEFWDRVSIVEQERMFGRRRDTGAPLDGNHEKDIPDFAQDPVGEAIPLTAHMRRANPRTPETAQSRILRRPYNYDQGVDEVGNLDQGLVFVCFQQDPDKQFAEIQRRLEGEPLGDYIQPVGGGYFLVLPGVRDANDYLGSALLSLA
jgi:deferrochelatase/peroxidase EfeB